jgi:tetratricopeptide (TPR) repeat protein
MNKIIKKIFSITILLVTVWLIMALGVSFYIVYQKHETARLGRKNIEGAKINAERDAKLGEIAMMEEQGEKYEEEGKYDLAIEQYKKALNMGGPAWVERALLADVYEKSGQYELAIQEIDWIIAQNPREEVKDEYIARKQKLEKLITERSM